METIAAPISGYQLRNYQAGRDGWTADLHHEEVPGDEPAPLLRVTYSGTRVRPVVRPATGYDPVAELQATAEEHYPSDPKHARIRFLRLLRTANLLTEHAQRHSTSVGVAIDTALHALPFVTNEDRAALVALPATPEPLGLAA